MFKMHKCKTVVVTSQIPKKVQSQSSSSDAKGSLSDSWEVMGAKGQGASIPSSIALVMHAFWNPLRMISGEQRM